MLRKFAISVAVVLFFALGSASFVAAVELPGVTKNGYIASPSRAILEQAINYKDSEDYVALKKLYDSKKILILKAGVKVFVTYPKKSNRRIKIRLPGSIHEIWTVRKAVTLDPP